MIIRKLMKFEGSHIVRNCTSNRCSRSWHGHSYKVEFMFTSNTLDAGGMVMDFGLMKPVKLIVDMFDHTTVVWDKESDDVKSFFRDNSERLIEMGISPSAENLSLLFMKLADAVVKSMEFNNGEKYVRVESVRVHETDTGWAEANWGDVESMLVGKSILDIIPMISGKILKENTVARAIMSSKGDGLGIEISNPIPEHQIGGGYE